MGTRGNYRCARSIRLAVIAPALIVGSLSVGSIGLVAFAASGAFYRACCADALDHGCSAWFDSESAAHKSGAEHRRKTNGHAWTIESKVPGE